MYRFQSVVAFCTLFALSPQAAVVAFQGSARRHSIQPRLHLHQGDSDSLPPLSPAPPSRRDWLLQVGSSALAIGSSSILLPSATFATEDQPPVPIQKNTKVLVLGGTGFVGSEVVQRLRDLGIDVIATSRSGRDGTLRLDFSQGDPTQAVQNLAAGCTAVISCIGSIGTPLDGVVNSGTGLAAVGAKAAGVETFVYITVAPEVKEFAKGIDFVKDYMDGKESSRNAVLQTFEQNAIFIEPTFIYGGGSFELNPPRVAKSYGKLVEGILSSSLLRKIEKVLSPGFLKIALEPPIPVEDVASAAVAGALGKTPGVLDTYDEIKRAGASLVVKS